MQGVQLSCKKSVFAGTKEDADASCLISVSLMGVVLGAVPVVVAVWTKLLF